MGAPNTALPILRSTSSHWHLINVVTLLKVLSYLTLVFLGFFCIGWLLNGFSVPLSLRLGSLLISCYLLWVGTEGLALTSIWVVSIMARAAIDWRWLHDLARPQYYYIPVTLMAIWLFILMVAWLMGRISHDLRQLFPHRQSSWLMLVLIAFAGMAVGWHTYSTTISYIARLF